MKNLKKLSRKQLKTVKGGDDEDKFYGGGCHCHGCAPSTNLPNGLPPIDIDANGSADCWSKCDRYRDQCKL